MTELPLWTEEPHRATQNAALLNALRSGPVSALDALRHLGIYRCGARVWDLRKMGYNITTTRRHGHVAVYKLEP
jgi:hypothetical protein